ncbi:SH3 domain-containing protein [Exiguobacterium alkaliphilum]|uniref:SH3 domain-containing protein n=1 Tax=Exiguobacterium alkaliphilum TaxID=1428684 RepID=UPI001BAB19B3|nr:SH3 domain-containing protein [Exiguobacterium alkaliphilum]QUE86191.1 SH3 domain-containing protein [Exiguobacterium alkaliphilum]
MKPTMTRLSVAVLVSSTVLSTIGPMQSYAATYEGTVNTSILNVRSSTSTTSTIVGKLTQGTTVHVYSTSNNWAEIDFQGQKRYVSSSYLTLKPTVAKTSTTQTYTANENVNMRSAMTTTAPIVTTIPKGATVTYVSTHGATGSWFKVTYGGKTGYVAQRYFTLSGGGTVTPQANATHTTVNNTSMHSSMISTAPVLVTIPKGASVTHVSTHGATGSWAKVTYAGKTGYVAMRNLQAIVTSAPTTLYVKTATSVFSSTSTTGQSLGTLAVGSSVRLVSTHGATGSWAKVTAGALTGYVPMRNLSETVVAAPVTPYYAQRAATMYSSMSTSRTVVQSIPVGAKVDHLSTHGATGSWYMIRYANKTGYVAARDFSLTAPSTSTEQYGPEREVQVVSNNTPLNVRPTPSTNNTAIGTLAHGTIVNVKPVLNTEWGILTSGSFVGGYIHLSYTAPVSTTPPTTGIQRVVSHTPYPISVRAMAERQVAQFGQTDAHRSAPAYLPRAWVSVSGNTGTIVNNQLRVISGVGTALKMSASSTAVTIATIPNGTNIEYVDRQVVGTAVWYRVKYGSMTGFVTPSSVVGAANILSQPSLTSHAYGQINPGETVTITGQTGTYYTVSYRRPAGHNIRIFDNVWRRASVTDLEPFVNPNNFDQNSQAFYQFLDLSKSAGTTAATLNRVLTNSGTLTNQGQAFINAANQYSINEIYLLAHAVHETGHGKSLLAQGVPVDKDGNALINSSGTRIHPDREVAATVYNMYGIQAVDSSPLATGAKFAFDQKWFTPEAAIVGGAYWIGASYINHPTHKQNTLYKMRFNPANPGVHQYATDIGWATKQTTRIYQTYQTLDSYTLHFDVPKFQ